MSDREIASPFSGPPGDASRHSFAISVDTAAAVRALTERTRPSLAFDVVRVVRRALALGAARVDVTCAADCFVVAWPGPGAPTAELELIARVLDAERAGHDDARSSALLALEEQHSLALLAVLATSKRAEVHGAGGATLATSSGRLVSAQSLQPQSSRARVIVWRDGDPADERRNLASWCRHADAPVYVNKKRVDGPFPTDHGGRLARLVRGPEGRAVVGLAADPSKSRVVIYSHGVYLGVGQRPRGSIPIVAHVSVKNFGPEDDAVAARKAVDVVIHAAEAALIRGIAQAFGDLSKSEQVAVRDALLDTDGTGWSASLKALPLFDAVAAPFSLTLDDLARVGARSGAVPATAYASGHLPGTPLVDVRTRNFLVRSLGDVVRPAIPARSAWSARVARVRGRPRVDLG